MRIVIPGSRSAAHSLACPAWLASHEVARYRQPAADLADPALRHARTERKIIERCLGEAFADLHVRARGEPLSVVDPEARAAER